jgi:farnesyl-diphosphate farnesyltransferase
MALAAHSAKRLPKEPGLHFCYDMLNRVSRSFAIVIQQLPGDLRDAVCVFYLVLRALDTVEDDMALADGVKLPALLDFHEKIYDRGFKMPCGEGHYAELMERMPLLVDVFLGLEEKYQAVIADITRRMGEGMAEFIEKEEVETVAEYDLYCHYVAGLVGVGLSELFASCGLEGEEFFDLPELSNRMGLFLQKTNIIRDYLEDITEEPAPRMFWPREIWGQYGATLADFQDARNRRAAVHCLNHMVTNALQHAVDSLDYMGRLRHKWVFRFCAIPQVMAIGTLAQCYNNGGVFEGVVKLRRGYTARLMMETNTYEDLVRTFLHFAGEIGASVRPKSDPSAQATLEVVGALEDRCRELLRGMGKSVGAEGEDPEAPPALVWRLALWLLFAAYAAYAFQLQSTRESLGLNPAGGDPFLDRVQQGIAAALLIFATYIAVTGKRF